MTRWSAVFSSRVDRLIAVGRLILATFALLALYLDPLQPAHHADITYLALALFLGYAAAICLLSWKLTARRAVWAYATHVIDLVVFSLLMHLTEGPTSPFFVFFTFSILAAALRWQWRGTITTALFVLIVFFTIGIAAGNVLSNPDFDLNRVIIRTVYLAVVALMLTYVGVLQEDMRRALAGLAKWPHGFVPHSDGHLRAMLDYAARVSHAPRVLVAYSEKDEPWLNLLLWSKDGLTRERVGPQEFEPLVAGPLAETPFFGLYPTAGKPVLIQRTPDKEPPPAAPSIHPDFLARFAIHGAIAAPLEGETCSGWLFLLDQTAADEDDLLITDIIASHLAAGLDQMRLLAELREAAVAETRLRLARDLHDGVLQSLTGTALQVHAARELVTRDPDGAVGRLGEIERAITDEQRQLRGLIDRMRPERRGPPLLAVGLATRLSGLAESLRWRWSLDLSLRVAPVDVHLPEALTREVENMVSEAVANAKRHGGATRVAVTIEATATDIRLRIKDNGCGFAFVGRRESLERVADTSLPAAAPKTLGERVAALGGGLAIESSLAGAELDISLPPRERESADAD